MVSSIKGFTILIIPFTLLITPFEIVSQKPNEQKSSQLENNINYSAGDSMILDMDNQKTYLYNNAHIDYGDIILDACYIEFNFEDKTVKAKYCLDSNDQKIGIPILTDGSTSTSSDSLKFNFETKIGDDVAFCNYGQVN